MKAFEQIQKEGPKRNPKESHPEKRSRKRSAKSESTDSRAVTSESQASTSKSTDSKEAMSESKEVMSESKAAMSESTESTGVVSESKVVASELTESEIAASESTSKAEASKLTESREAIPESRAFKTMTPEWKPVEDGDKGEDLEEMKEEPPPSGSAVDKEVAEDLVAETSSSENHDTLVNVKDENVDQNAEVKSELKWKKEDGEEDGGENDLLRGKDVGKSPVIVENVKDDEGEEKVVSQCDQGDLQGELEIAVKKEEEEIPSMEDGRSELEHQPVEAEEKPSLVGSTAPQKTGKCSEAAVVSESLSKAAEAEGRVAVETTDSPSRSNIRGGTPNLERMEEESKDETALPLRRSKRRQPSGASQTELPPQTKELEMVIKEPSLDTIPDCGVPCSDESVSQPREEAEAAVKPVVRSKGRPRKIPKVCENVGKKEDNGKKPTENKFEHRVRTRSCTKEADSGVGASKAKPLGRKVSNPSYSTIVYVIVFAKHVILLSLSCNINEVNL